MIGPLDAVVRIFLIESYPVQRLDVLHVGRVATENPWIRRHDIGNLRHIYEQLGIGKWKIRKLESRTFSIVCKHNPVALAGGEFKQARSRWRRIANLGRDANSICIIAPMMKRASKCIALHVADRKIRTEMRAVGAHDLRGAALAAKRNHAPIEEIGADDFARRQFTRQTNREPRL